MHHPKSNIDRLYLQRNNGGRRLIHLETFYKSSTIGLFHYLSNTGDWMLKLVYLHENSKNFTQKKPINCLGNFALTL